MVGIVIIRQFISSERKKAVEKRKFEKLNVEASLLGFGCMRFPTTKENKIDEVESEQMLDLAYKSGVNYFDTAYLYHDGDSETFVGKALNKYDRSTYYLATKLPPWVIEKEEDTVKVFEEQLKKLDKDYIDFYLIHALDKDRWEKVKALKIVETCEKLQKEGRIKYLGFSFHDKYKVFEEIITSRKWDFCQIQYNYMDTKENPGQAGYDLADQLGVPLVVMEPIRGGGIASFSDDINEEFYKLDREKSIASYALRWVANHPNVKVILSGMSSLKQTEDNLKTFTHYQPLTEAEKNTIDKVVKILAGRVKNPCTGCRYCMPCPSGVDIPHNFTIWNNYHVYQTYDIARFGWENALGEEMKPKSCIKCGKCEAACPQHINIREDLVKVQEDLDRAKAAAQEA